MQKRNIGILTFFALVIFCGCQSGNGKQKVGIQIDHISRTPGIHLFDNYLNTWTTEVISSSPEKTAKVLPCSFCTFLSNGDFITGQDGKVSFWNADGSLKWEKEITMHHDLFVDEVAKEVFFVVGKKVPWKNGKRKRIDQIHGYDFSGKQIFFWSFIDNKKALDQIYGTEIPLRDAENYWEYSHFNSVQSIPESPLAKKSPNFRAGNILVSDYWNNIVFLIDRKSKKIVWSTGNESDRRFWHSVRLLPNGEMIAFQNKTLLLSNTGATTIEKSSIVFFNPITNSVDFQITKINGEEFFSDIWGSLQLVGPNRYLVTLSQEGRAVEIDQDGKVFWSWQRPPGKDAKDKSVYRVTLVPQQAINSNSLWVKTYLTK